jgi:hypothetical protein
VGDTLSVSFGGLGTFANRLAVLVKEGDSKERRGGSGCGAGRSMEGIGWSGFRAKLAVSVAIIVLILDICSLVCCVVNWDLTYACYRARI